MSDRVTFFGFVLLFLLLLGTCKTEFSDQWQPEFDEQQQIEDPIELSPSEDELFIEEDPEWASNPALRRLGGISAAVSLDPTGSRIMVLHRADRSWNENTFDKNNVLRRKSDGPISDGVLALFNDGELAGKYLKNRFYMPHGLAVDQQQNIWITDVGLHQVFKFGPNRTEAPLLTLGEAFRPGNDSRHFCKPTHVAVASNGDFFVSDGYCNNRIMKFDATGNLLTQWGQETIDFINPGPYDLNLPHELLLVEDEDLLCVADRQNYRVVCYIAGLTPASKNNTGRFVTEFREELDRSGPVYGIAFHPGTRLLFVLVEVDGVGEVQVFEFGSKQYLGRITGGRRGIGMAHTISTCQSQLESGCLLVSNLNAPSSDPQPERARPGGLRFYRFDAHNVELV